MAIELAVALSVIGAKTVVGELIKGTPITRDGWAEVAKDVIDALVTNSSSQESGLDRLGRQIAEIPIREFGEHMAAGRRFLRDLPVAWRTEQDRRDLIRDARNQFVQAFGIAEQMNDMPRQVIADVAIAGCWLWVPSLPDVLNTIGAARRNLEQHVIHSQYDSDTAASFADVLTLCRAFRECPVGAAVPVATVSGLDPFPGAEIKVQAVARQWVEYAGIKLRIGQLQAGPPLNSFTRQFGPSYALPVEIHNTRERWISVGFYGSPSLVGQPGSRCKVAGGSSTSLILTGHGDTKSGRVAVVAATEVLVRENRFLMVAFIVPTPQTPKSMLYASYR